MWAGLPGTQQVPSAFSPGGWWPCHIPGIANAENDADELCADEALPTSILLRMESFDSTTSDGLRSPLQQLP